MAQTILIKRSNVAAKIPTNAQLVDGELAINTADGKVFVKSSSSLRTVATDVSEVGSVLTNQTVTGNVTSGTQTVTGNATVGGTLGVTGATTLDSLGVTNNSTIGGTLGVTGATTLDSLGVTNNSTVGGTLGVTGAITASGGVTVPAGQSLQIDGTATFAAPPTYPAGTAASFPGGLTVPAGQALTLDSVAITNVRKFEIKDSTGSVVNGFYVLDTDSTITN
jgi:fibronectin-binding autotransporter adhesin